MRLLLARHGETEAHRRGHYIGATDLPLSAIGRGQARQLAAVLPVRLSRCWCSPLGRARETAALALAGFGCQVTEMDTLREIDFGRWEGLSFAEIVERDPLLVEQWIADPLHFEFPGGEGTAQFRLRVAEALHAIIDAGGDEVLVICHGGVIRTMLCTLLGIDFSRNLAFSIRPAALSVVEFDGRHGVLHGLNLTAMSDCLAGAR